jgi:hypothetical protein
MAHRNQLKQQLSLCVSQSLLFRATLLDDSVRRIRVLLLPVVVLLLTFRVCAAESGFTVLQSTLRDANVASVEQLIAALPFTLRSRYALVFDSRSLQGASFRDPRVILYGPDARLVVTFNGDPSQRGFRTVETMEFRSDTKEFLFREVQFPLDGTQPAAVLVSEANPQRCTRCHGIPARPIWDTHPLWPGAYGERYGANLSGAEYAGLIAFLAQQPTHPRYRNLLAVERFDERATFRETPTGRYAGSGAESPNAELANLLAQLQFQSIARTLSRQPRFALFRYALLGMAENTCGPLADFYPDSLWRSERSRFQLFVHASALAASRQSQYKKLRALRAYTDRSSAADSLVGFRYVSESGLGVPTQGWSLALEQDTYDFTLPPFATLAMRDALLSEIAPQDQRLGELSLGATSVDGDRYCSYLKRRSRAALQESTAGSSAAASPEQTVAPVGERLRAPDVLRQCIDCHESGVAPQHSFSRPGLLRIELRAPSSAHGTLLDEIRFRLSPSAGARAMPLGRALPDADIRSLNDYFTTLAASPDD